MKSGALAQGARVIWAKARRGAGAPPRRAAARAACPPATPLQRTREKERWRRCLSWSHQMIHMMTIMTKKRRCLRRLRRRQPPPCRRQPPAYGETVCPCKWHTDYGGPEQRSKCKSYGPNMKGSRYWNSFIGVGGICGPEGDTTNNFLQFITAGVSRQVILLCVGQTVPTGGSSVP